MGVFGSYARGEQREGSDLDLLIELGDDIDLIGYAGLQIELSDALGVPVDLVEREALRPDLPPMYWPRSCHCDPRRRRMPWRHA